MSGDPDNEYFSDGITDDIIMRAHAGEGAARRGADVVVRVQGEERGSRDDRTTLGVTSVLQGSVRRAGNRVRVTVQLMNAQDGFQLWSERFDRDLDDIFAIQDEIARRHRRPACR